MINKEDGAIDWEESAEIIERQIRAYISWPGSYTNWEGKRIKIISTDASDKIVSKNAGTVILLDNEMFVQTGEGSLEIKKLQLEGKNPVSSMEFINGYSNIDGARLK